MKFRNDSPIYIQIEEYVRENILKGKWRQEDRVPSIRDLAVEMEVNPNTVMRAYSDLQDHDIIYNKRGIGYFIEMDAKKRVLEKEKEKFLEKQLTRLFAKMNLLNINFKDLKEHYREYELKGDNNETIK